MLPLVMKPFHIGKYMFEHVEATRDQARKLGGQAMLLAFEHRLQPEARCDETGIQHNEGDATSVAFAAYDGDKLIGGFLLYGIKVREKSDERIRIDTHPLPGFPVLEKTEEYKLIRDIVHYFLHNDLETVENKKVQVNSIVYYFYNRNNETDIDIFAREMLEYLMKNGTFPRKKEPDARMANRYKITFSRNA